jgi:CRP-like cAMP-binding protein
MISREDLKQIVMLRYLTDGMLDKLTPVSELLQFEEKEYIFRQGDKAVRLYFVVHGKVVLEQRVSANVTISLSGVRPGYSFGWSAMLDEDFYTSDAICAEQSRLISFRADKLKALFDQDHSLGYIMSQRLLRVIKKRYEIRTEQFVKAIRHHPDIGSLL